jgi:hypothetical protein
MKPVEIQFSSSKAELDFDCIHLISAIAALEDCLRARCGS